MNVKNEALVVVIENPYKEIKQDKNGALATTKENRHHAHGYGLPSIIKVASKYDGEVLTEFYNNLFKLTMILNLPD
jgi:sensor histidine kinase YesM